jgi:RNA polymerase sporulation-specific sigma factor
MDTISLIKQAHSGDKASRDKILTDNMPLIWSVVGRFINRGYEREDLFQIGCIGMLKAIDRFDISFNVAFSTYAVPLITGEIRRFLRDDGIIKISRTIKENQNKILVATAKFREENNKEPTMTQLSEMCHITEEDVVCAIDSLRTVESIYKESDGKDGNKTFLLDSIEDKRATEEKTLNRIMVNQLLSTLDKKDKKIIELRYFKNKTQSEIAQYLGVTQVQVSRMEKKILNSLKKQL